MGRAGAGGSHLVPPPESLENDSEPGKSGAPGKPWKAAPSLADLDLDTAGTATAGLSPSPHGTPRHRGPTGHCAAGDRAGAALGHLSLAIQRGYMEPCPPSASLLDDTFPRGQRGHQDPTVVSPGALAAGMWWPPRAPHASHATAPGALKPLCFGPLVLCPHSPRSCPQGAPSPAPVAPGATMMLLGAEDAPQPRAHGWLCPRWRG